MILMFHIFCFGLSIAPSLRLRSFRFWHTTLVVRVLYFLSVHELSPSNNHTIHTLSSSNNHTTMEEPPAYGALRWLYETGEASDFTISTSTKDFKVHSFILKHKSLFFRAGFSGEFPVSDDFTLRMT